MALHLTLLALSAVAGASSSLSENFDSLSTGSYSSFSAFGGHATFSAYGAGSILADPGSLPPRSNPNAIFGNGAAVVITFDQTWNHITGYFRVPSFEMLASSKRTISSNPTFAVVELYRNGSQVGLSVYSIVKDDRYTIFDWDLAEEGGFDSIVILGNGGNGDLIGMDDMTVSS